jgi:asparagine synthase (glutamine-hydrolysing)
LETLITQRTLTNIPEKEHIYNLNQLLSRSVCDRMVSDVPVGAFLSGGIDSSLICALMQINSRSPIKTFTVGYHNSPFDESPYAERIARYLGTEHTTLYVDEKKALWAIDHTIDFYDEPFGDLSAVATYLICELFKEHVTVALSGDGGDEIFCGYNRHIWAPRIAKYNGMIPSFIKSPLAKMLLKINPIFLDKVFNRFQPFIGDKIYKVLRSLNTSDILKVYLNSVSYFRSEGVNDLGEKCWYRLHRGIEKNEEQVAYLDMRTYLHDDVLCKVDRASMAVGLETRAPFLDYDLVAYTWNIPVHVKLKKNIKKYLSKKILETYVPKRLWDRPKMGFGIPVSSWMRTSLKTYFENIIFRDSFVWEWYSKREIIKLWQDHLSGRKNNELCLWNIFVAQKWASQMFG